MTNNDYTGNAINTINKMRLGNHGQMPQLQKRTYQTKENMDLWSI